MDMMRGSKVPSPLLSEHADAMWNTVSFHRNLVISEFAQHHVDQLDHALNPVQQMQTIFPELDGKLTDTRQYLGKYGITKTLGTQLIGTMSGGQKTRVALAIVTFNRPHVLLLDEPTNHLDQHSIEALIEGIKSFEGAVVVVSHDRQLIQESMKEFIVVKANKKKKVKLSKKQKKRKKQGLDITTATESTKSSNTGLPQSRVVLYKKTFADYLKSISTK
jgi:ATP-binding cassette subfamily F protein 3